MRKPVTLLIVALSILACSKPTPSAPAGTGLTYDQFVNVMVELKLNPPEERASILKRHQTTEAKIRGFVTAHSRDPALLSMAFDSIQARLDRKHQAGE